MRAPGWTVKITIGATLALAGFVLTYFGGNEPTPAEAKPVLELSAQGSVMKRAPAIEQQKLPIRETKPELEPEVEPTPGLAGEPVFHPRAESEWQGMLVNLAAQATCEMSSRCGLAMACHDGQCGPCSADGECGEGEACVLDHCLPAAQVSCRTRSDCRGEDELCVLTGYSADPRGNASMHAKCQGSTGGTAQKERELTEGRPEPGFDRGQYDSFLSAVREHANTAGEN